MPRRRNRVGNASQTEKLHADDTDFLYCVSANISII